MFFPTGIGCRPKTDPFAEEEKLQYQHQTFYILNSLRYTVELFRTTDHLK